MTETATSSGSAAWGRLVLIALTVIALDQATKFLAVQHLTYAFEHAHATTLSQQVNAFIHAQHLTNEAKAHVDTVPAFWSNRYAENPGAAWSLLANAPEKIRVPFFHLVSLLAIVLIGVYYSKLRSDQPLLRTALALVMGGAIGNLIDRMIRGYVIDFIDWHLNDPDWHAPLHHWPTFNVADTGITLGVILIAIDTLLSWWASRKTGSATASADA